MPRTGMKHSGQLETRNAYTKVDVEFTVSVDGKELPAMGVVGEALEKAIELFNAEIKQSYQVVPVRIDTPVATPYASVKPDGS